VIIQAHTKIRPARAIHRRELLRLLSSAERAHCHLDWQSAEGWLQHQRCHVAFADSSPIGMLSIPVVAGSTAWLRLAAVRDDERDTPTMTPLWVAARAELQQQGVTRAAALTANVWPESLLPPWGFAQCGHVVVLHRGQAALPPLAETGARIRAATEAHLQAIFTVDKAAFEPLWRYSLQILGLALKQAAYATVACAGSDIVGYLLATQANGKVFLARLAVTPDFQNRGVGRALTLDMLHHFARRRAPMVEVNTQADNVASIALYQALDFELTAERAQAWQCELGSEERARGTVN
jgi:ribosomal protein S18 acetylase RimI-like enzyme